MAKVRIDPAVRLAGEILPDMLVRSGEFKIRDVANWSIADQRDMVSLKRKRTIRRLSHLEKLQSRNIISERQRKICEWYAEQHEKGFEVSCSIANYSGSAGSPPSSMDLLAKTRDQYLARQMYAQARSAISPALINLFERIVIGQTELGGGETWRRKSALKNTFRLAVDQLDEAFGHLAGGE